MIKKVNDSSFGRKATFVLIVLIGFAAILIVLRAGTIANTSIQDAKKTDDIEYQLRLLQEKQKTPPAQPSAR